MVQQYASVEAMLLLLFQRSHSAIYQYISSVWPRVSPAADKAAKAPVLWSGYQEGPL